MKLKLTVPDNTTKTLKPRDVTEHYATATCNQYGWGIRSAAWYDLASTTNVSIDWLCTHAQKMHPGATVEVVAEGDP